MDDIESLKSLIRVKNAQIKSLNQELLETPLVADQGGTAQKVLELAKKNKRLVVALEREKALSASLKIQKESQKQLQKTVIVDIPEKVKETDQLKVVRDKLGIAFRKLEDEKIQNKHLKTELLKTQKALVKEVGNVPLDTLLEESASWKGRAQTIIVLKKKLQDLQSAGKSPLDKQVKKDPFKKDNLDLIIQELESAKESLGVQTQKTCTLKARNKVLELEISRLREKMSTLILKIERDDDYIQALQKKIPSSFIDSRKELEEKDKIIQQKCLEISRLEKESHMARIEKGKNVDSNSSLHGQGSSDLAQVRVLKIENSRLLELVNNYQSKVLELESRLSQTDILLSKERRKVDPSSQISPKENRTKLEEQLLMLKDENQCLKSMI